MRLKRIVERVGAREAINRRRADERGFVHAASEDRRSRSSLENCTCSVGGSKRSCGNVKTRKGSSTPPAKTAASIFFTIHDSQRRWKETKATARPRATAVCPSRNPNPNPSRSPGRATLNQGHHHRTRLSEFAEGRSRRFYTRVGERKQQRRRAGYRR